MKNMLHAVAGVLGFVVVLTLVGSTAVAYIFGGPEMVAQVKGYAFYGTISLPLLLMAAGATGMSMLGTRTEPRALTKQKRGPVGFMTSLFVLLPSAYFLSSWSAEGDFGALYYGVQGLELAASGLVLVMVGLNIRDGLALRGRIRAGAAEGPVIEERNGGPLVVMGGPILYDGTAQAAAGKPVMALCRCGKSKNKPFCDGSHNEFDFDTSPSDDRTKDEVLVYEGTEVTIHYNRLLCSHAAECGRRAKAAFDSSRKPWIVPDNASKETLLEVVEACPSGALRIAEPGRAPEHLLPDGVVITAEKDGPYRVSGVPLGSARLATGASADKYVLCRCGASKNKPYCDGSHYDIGWTSANG